MTEDEVTKERPVRQRRRVVLIGHGEGDACCEGLLHSASGEPLDLAIEAALAGREHGVSVRVSEELLAKLDVLVESGMFESRSAAATFLMREGVTANADLFQAVESTSQRISELRDALRARLAPNS